MDRHEPSPAHRADRHGDHRYPQISFQVDQAHSSLLVVAEAPELVARSLVRVDAALDDLPTTAEFDSVRDRRRAMPTP